MLPTATSIPATATSIPATATSIPATATVVVANSAFATDGSNDLAIGPALSGNLRTVELWVRPNANNANAVIVSQSSGSRGWSLELTSGRATFWVADSAGTWRRAINSNVRLVANQWYHVAATYDGTNARVYVNGNQGTSANLRTLAPAGVLRVGGLGGFAFFNGQMDKLRISSVVRYTAAFTAPGRFSSDVSTLALYHFDEGSGQVANDSSANVYHLSLGTSTGVDTADPGWISSTAPGR
ncbi:MAG: hypothetical protein Fur005_24710 [Roseiflexaceae bacterium]